MRRAILAIHPTLPPADSRDRDACRFSVRIALFRPRFVIPLPSVAILLFLAPIILSTSPLEYTWVAHLRRLNYGKVQETLFLLRPIWPVERCQIRSFPIWRYALLVDGRNNDSSFQALNGIWRPACFTRHRMDIKVIVLPHSSV